MLAHFSISPALGGRFVLLTPRMVGFVADQALPVGTRVRVTLGAGLRDLAGDSLARRLAWTFGTPALNLTDLPQLGPDEDGDDAGAGGRKSEARDHRERRARRGARCRTTRTLVGRRRQRRRHGGARSDADAGCPGSNAAELFDPSLNDLDDTICARQRNCARGTTYALRIAPGVTPQYGNVPTLAELRRADTHV